MEADDRARRASLPWQPRCCYKHRSAESAVPSSSPVPQVPRLMSNSAKSADWAAISASLQPARHMPQMRGVFCTVLYQCIVCIAMHSDAMTWGWWRQWLIRSGKEVALFNGSVVLYSLPRIRQTTRSFREIKIKLRPHFETDEKYHWYIAKNKNKTGPKKWPLQRLVV